MGLKIFRNGSRGICRVWYGRFTRNGQKYDMPLGVPVKGEIPLTNSGGWDRGTKGDADFEKSKKEAQAAFDRLVAKEDDQRKKLKKAESQILALTGQQIGKTPLSKLADKWLSLERNRKPTEMRVNAARRTFDGFALFAAKYSLERGFRCVNLEDITPEIAKAYFENLSSQFAWGTVKEKYGAMRNAWRRWSRANDRSNPFGEIIIRKGEEDTGRVSRVPLTAIEAARLFEIVREKRPSLYPLLCCVACSGLRLGDACSLRWSEVHFSNESDRRRGIFGTIEKRTSKTGALVTIPIIQPLADELIALEGKRDIRDEYIFPEMLKRYRSEGTRTGLIREIKPFMALAVNPHIIDGKLDPVEVISESGGLELDDIIAAINTAKITASKKERLLRIAREYYAGFPAVSIAEGMKIARAQVSQYLRDIEDITKTPIRIKTKALKGLELKTDRRSLLDMTRAARSVGKCQASIYGWHSLRATFVVLAVEAGVPLAYIEKIVGHSTTAMTLQYFNPTGKHAAEIMGQKLGKSLSAAVVEVSGAQPEPVNPVALTAKDALSSLSESERKKLRRMLLEEMNLI